MKKKYTVLGLGMLAITLLDALGSIASRQLNFNYAVLAPLVFIIYGCAGFVAALQYKLSTGILVAATVGLFDATIGWKISMVLKANTGAIENNPSITVWVITAIIVTGTAALFGLIGGGLSLLIKKKVPDSVS